MEDQCNDQQPQKVTTFTHFQGFQCLTQYVQNMISFQNHFQVFEDDIFLASMPKAGTTWLKSVAFTVVNRHRFSLSNSPLHSLNPHDLVPYLEMTVYNNGILPDFTNMSSPPRLFSTHLPYHALAESIKNSNARIVYITRNPLDIIVSLWHFVRSVPGELDDGQLDEFFEYFCRGEEGYGPFWDHVVGYWKKSIEKPNKVLFLKYEEMKGKPVDQIKNMAEFMGCRFSEKEEKAGVIEEIAEFCSFGNLKNLEVNKNGNLNTIKIMETKSFFRKGEMDDYVNLLSPSAVERYSKIVEEKLNGFGLTFEMCC